MSAQMTERPERCTPISEANFVAEVIDLATFYKDRIPLHWEDALHDLIDIIEKEADHAAD